MLILLFPQNQAALAPNPDMPFCTVVPVVSGTEAEDETLSCTTGTWTGAATIAYTYQWYEDSLAPVNTVAPVVSGTEASGSTLTCTLGTWTGTPTIVYTYQWYRVGGVGGDVLTDELGNALLDELGEELTT